MVDVPAAIPVMVPVEPEPKIVAGPGGAGSGEIVHEPPAVASLTVTTEPTQIKNVPVIAVGLDVTTTE
jgi:hypothetical protein